MASELSREWLEPFHCNSCSFHTVVSPPRMNSSRKQAGPEALTVGPRPRDERVRDEPRGGKGGGEIQITPL